MQLPYMVGLKSCLKLLCIWLWHLKTDKAVVWLLIKMSVELKNK